MKSTPAPSNQETNFRLGLKQLKTRLNQELNFYLSPHPQFYQHFQLTFIRMLKVLITERLNNTFACLNVRSAFKLDVMSQRGCSDLV